MSHDSTHDDHHEGVGHVAPLRALIGTGLALMVLTWVTVAVAKIDMGEMNIYVALSVAVVKATLVALYFMHLRWDRPFNSIVFIGSICFVMLFIAIALTDTAEYQVDIEAYEAASIDPEVGTRDARLVVEQLKANAMAAEAARTSGAPASGAGDAAP